MLILSFILKSWVSQNAINSYLNKFILTVERKKNNLSKNAMGVFNVDKEFLNHLKININVGYQMHMQDSLILENINMHKIFTRYWIQR